MGLCRPGCRPGCPARNENNNVAPMRTICPLGENVDISDSFFVVISEMLDFVEEITARFFFPISISEMLKSAAFSKGPPSPKNMPRMKNMSPAKKYMRRGNEEISGRLFLLIRTVCRKWSWRLWIVSFPSLALATC